MKTWMWSVLVAIIITIAVGLILSAKITSKKEVGMLNDSISKLDSTARAERALAIKNDDLATSAQADLETCKSEQEELNDSLTSLTLTMATQDSTLKATLAACSVKPAKIKAQKAVSDSTTLAAKLPAGVKGKSKPR